MVPYCTALKISGYTNLFTPPREREIVIARNGRPVAKLVPLTTAPSGKRIGVAKGLFVVPDSIDNDKVAKLFEVRS
jgi:antitoxin (DNA-binding transcriptional repressor) of toxin-antitoxin stability system